MAYITFDMFTGEIIDQAGEEVTISPLPTAKELRELERLRLQYQLQLELVTEKS